MCSECTQVLTTCWWRAPERIFQHRESLSAPSAAGLSEDSPTRCLSSGRSTMKSICSPLPPKSVPSVQSVLSASLNERHVHNKQQATFKLRSHRVFLPSCRFPAQRNSFDLPTWGSVPQGLPSAQNPLQNFFRQNISVMCLPFRPTQKLPERLSKWAEMAKLF